MQIEVWAQLFNVEGDVSQGLRIPAEDLSNPVAMDRVAKILLDSVNWDEGFLLVWGAGNLTFSKVSASLSKGLSFLVSVISTPWSQEHRSPELNALDQE